MASSIGVRRAPRTVQGVVEGIIGGETLQCGQMAFFPPTFKGRPSAYKRVRRLVHGETVRRSDSSEEKLSKALQPAGMKQLAGAEEVWVALDSSDLPEPHAEQIEAPITVRDLDGLDIF